MKTEITELHGVSIKFVISLFMISIIGIADHVIASESKELLFFRHEGGLSSFRFTELLIQNDGSGGVKFQRGNTDKEEYSFKLNEYELEAIRTLVNTVDFFKQPDNDSRFATDTGQSSLRISLNGQNRELRFKYRPELNPLTICLNKLINQGIIFKDLENKGDVYSALGALSENLASAKVLQPEVFREPLIKFIDNTNVRQKLLDSFEALSWIMTPEEWMGLLSKELNNVSEEKKIMLLEALSSHPFTGNISTAHRDMLSPLLLSYLRLDYKDWPHFSKEKQTAYSNDIRFIGERRYKPAIPILMELLTEQIGGKIKPVTWLHNALTQTGEAVIQPLEPLLDSTNPDARASAVGLLGDILASNPDWPTKNSIPQNEQERILRILRTDVRPKIQKLAENDTSSLVRQLARSALKQIDEGWRNK